MSENNNKVDSKGKIKIEKSLLTRARNNDKSAIKEMFNQFIPKDETIIIGEYLGTQGLWGFGNTSLGCITNKRISSLQIGAFGEVIYQDGYLEHLNSTFIYQPSLFSLYIWSLILILLALVTFGLALLLFPMAVKTYYRFNKCGLVFIIREGLNVYMFTNRKLLVRANNIYREVAKLIN